MTYIGANAIAILVATLAGLTIGAVFYAVARPQTVQRRYRLRLLVVGFIAEFWLAAILAGALILAPVQANAWTIAVGTAVVIWIGFVVPALAVSYTFHGIGIFRLASDCAHWLLLMVAQAVVLHLIGLVRP